MVDWLLWLCAGVLLLTGSAGLVLPVLPGPLLMFAGMWLAAWAGHFQRIGWLTLTVLAILTGLSLLLDMLAGMLGAKRFGASRAGLLGAVLGGIVLLPFGPLGFLFGPFCGAFAGEMLAQRDVTDAARAGFGAWIGQILGIVIKLALAVAMLGIFLGSFLWHASS